MKKLALLAALCLLISSQWAMGIDYTVRPADVVSSEKVPEFINGTALFAWDPDGMSSPSGTPADYPTGYSSASWNADISAAGQYVGLRISPFTLSGTGRLTLNEISSIQFRTKQVSYGDQGRPDWYLKIYTNDIQDPPGWFGNRFETFPGEQPSGAWNTWNAEVMAWNHRPYGGSTTAAVNSFADIKSIAGTEQIMWIELLAGNTGTNVFSSNLDGIVLETTDGRVADINLEAPVPEPMTMLAVGSAVAGLGGYLRRRKQA